MSRAISRCAGLCLLLAAVFAGGGCGATVYSPLHPIEPVTIYVADYGRHSSVFFPMGHAAYVEYSYGDWNFYALGHTSNSDGAQALFWSQAATIARRYARSAPPQPDPPHHFEARIFPLCVSCGDMQQARDKLEQEWISLAATKIYNPKDDSEFVRERGHYSILYTCNDWTADVLREMKCRVVGITTTSDFHPGDPPPATVVSAQSTGG